MSGMTTTDVEHMRKGYVIAHERGGHDRFRDGIDDCPLCEADQPTLAAQLADALDDLHRYSLIPDHGYAGSPCEEKVRAALKAAGRDVP